MRNVDNYVFRWRYIILPAVVLTLSMMFSLTTLAAAPVLDRASTNGDGTAIILTFDKEMGSPVGEHGQFSATVTEAVYFSGAALDSDNNTRIILTIDGSPVSNTDDSITISYTEGNVADSDGQLLIGFTGESVVNAVFDSGNGDSGDPYVITNADQLDAVRYHRDKDFELGNNINLNVAPYNQGEGWEPVGTLAHPFTGTFDGGENTISGLLIDRSDTDYVGLFSCVGFGAVIQNLELQGVDVTGNEFAGGLAGLSEGNITNCNVTGDTGILIGNNVVGGLVGWNAYGTISNSNTQIQVSGNKKVGGLAGVNINGGVVTESYAVSGVQGTESVGGLAGENNGTISSSYATGDISGVVNIGGLVGLNWGTISGSNAAGAVESVNNNYVGGLVGQNGSNSSAAIIENCYATGVVTGNRDYVGGLVGNFIHGSVRNCYALNAEIISNSGSTYIRFGRIAGCVDADTLEKPVTLSENWANSDMTEPFAGAYTVKTHDGKDGADLYAWNITGGILTVTFLPVADNTTVSATTNPESPEVAQNFTFTVQVHNGADNPISDLETGDFTITENGTGDITVASIVENGTPGDYTVTASHDTAETITISVAVLDVEVGSIEDLVIQAEGEAAAGAEIWAWGWNSYNQLGDGTTDDKDIPTHIGADSDWAAVSAGYRHTAALKMDGSLWAWGNNEYGQVGDGTTDNKDTPTRIGTDSDWAVVSAGDGHTTALKTDGSLWAWGQNGFGQLGDGTTDDKYTPTRIGTDSNWAAVSAGGGHTVALIGAEASTPTADQAIALAKIALTWDVINGANSAADNVRVSLVNPLPTTGAYGTSITWSVDPDSGCIDTTTGAVTRPSYSEGNKTVTLTATISKAGGAAQTKSFTLTIKAQASTGGGSSGRTAPAPEPGFNATIEAGDYQQDLDVDVDDRKGIMEVNLDDDTVSCAFEETEADSDGVKTVNIEMPEIDDVTSYRLQIPEEFHSSGSGDNRIQMITGIGTVVLPDNMLGNMELETGTQAAFTIAQADVSDIDEETKNLIGDRPIVQLTLTLDGDQTNWSNPDAPVTVSIPYEPTEDELLDPEHITVWYIDGSGNAVSVPSGRYDRSTGTVTFDTTHFSNYAVVYVAKTFDDLSNVDWAKKPIEVLASKGIVRGITDSQYYPSINIRRADFLYSLVRALGVDAAVEGNFDDISQDAYYYKEIGIAKKLGITSGIGNNKFNPDASITRQDMMVLTERAFRMLGMIKEQSSATNLDGFADKSLIASYAIDSMASVVKEGLIIGSGDCINPLGNTTRAEAAVFLYRVYNK